MKILAFVFTLFYVCNASYAQGDYRKNDFYVCTLFVNWKNDPRSFKLAGYDMAKTSQDVIGRCQFAARDNKCPQSVKSVKCFIATPTFLNSFLNW